MCAMEKVKKVKGRMNKGCYFRQHGWEGLSDEVTYEQRPERSEGEPCRY